MSQERIKHPPVRLGPEMSHVFVNTLQQCVAQSDWSIAAASVESTHTHLLLTYTERAIDNTVKWIKDRATKQIHRRTPHQGPVWCKGKWCTFVFDVDAWEHARDYIQQHNIRRGAGPRPYRFVDADFIP